MAYVRLRAVRVAARVTCACSSADLRPVTSTSSVSTHAERLCWNP